MQPIQSPWRLGVHDEAYGERGIYLYNEVFYTWELGGEAGPYYNLRIALLLICSFQCAIRSFLRVFMAGFHSRTRG